jgi:hypothetical protein
MYEEWGDGRGVENDVEFLHENENDIWALRVLSQWLLYSFVVCG